MQKLVKLLEQLAEKFNKKKRHFPQFAGNKEIHVENDSCWICGEAFAEDDVKILDHCHYSGKVLGYAHGVCNLQRRRTKFTPIFAHNLANYDIHHVIRALKTGSENNTISVVHLNEEKIVSLSLKVWLGSFKTKNRHVRHIYEEMRFLDSYKFMLSSLDTLARNLPKDKFVYLDSQFSAHSPEGFLSLLIC